MNSYPPELLVQLAPVMLVAGLEAFPAPSDEPSTPSSPRPNDFDLLATRLREVLQEQRKVTIWQPEKVKTFQVIFVEKGARFPPRKLVPPEDPPYSSAHSPLSPLTPTSPLHPDGLIAPIWIRKHTSLVPSVFVLFLRIFEFPPTDVTASPLDLPDSSREKEQEERKRDTELATEIAFRKKSTSERGLKLTVVLMATRKMLDDPSLDNRLTFIRRNSGLDSRAALFVLSPVSPSELGEFVKSLQQALYEPALEYYTAHSKRVRRKRNRHSQTTTYSNPMPSVSNIPRPLRPEGWTVRYEYKMACFAEFRGEDEVALKHYQDAYSTLVLMFGSPVILPPRTKRWAEAKVLADCINIKISKLYLYNNEHALALSHHNSHVRIFGDLSRGWSIGEETFEYWSWIARQHRVFAELLEQGTRSTLIIPVHKSLQTTSHASSARVSGTSSLEVESTRSPGLNPSHALQHPGFYYFMAAKCTERRREKFLKTLKQEDIQIASSTPPGFLNEKKVDHPTIILELYTKAYELFKKYTPVDSQNITQSRLTVWIAHQIARTYFENAQYNMALRFYERIAKAYRGEKWGVLLRPLLSSWCACARELGDVELSIRLLVEMLGHDAPEHEMSAPVEDDLVAILKSTKPSTDGTLIVDLSESQPIYDSNVVFWTPEIEVGESSAFQLTLIAPPNVSLSSLPISTLYIHFSHQEDPVVVRHRESESSQPLSFQLVNVGHVSSTEVTRAVFASLRWQSGGCFIFHGTISSDMPSLLKVAKLVLTMEEGAWRVEIPFSPCSYRRGLPPIPRWLSAVEPPQYLPVKREGSSFVKVRHRNHNLVLSVTYEPTAYLNEEFPITITIINADYRPLSVVVDVLLPPMEIDGAENMISLGQESSTNFIKGVSFGVLAPGLSSVKTLYLMSTGVAGSRVVDISVQSQPTTALDEPEERELQDMTETLKTLVIPTVDPIESSQTVSYSRNLHDWLGLASLETFDKNIPSSSMTHEVMVRTKIMFAGSSVLRLESVSLARQDHLRASITDCSTDGAVGALPSHCHPGDEIVHICRANLISSEEGGSEDHVKGIGSYHVKWQRVYSNGELGSLSTTVIPLPPLQPPAEGLLALLSVPSAATLHVPFPLTLTIRNYHPSRSANVVFQLELDASDGFVVAGVRSGRVSILMPGEEEKLTWQVVPIECGHISLPRIKVLDKRPTFTGGTEPTAESITKGEKVAIVDVRFDRRDGQLDAPDLEDRKAGTILVLP